MIREDFITTQYIWALENEQVFVTKARHYIERDQLRQFFYLVQYHTRDLRRELNDVPSTVEWAYLLTEMWARMGGHLPNYGWNSQDADLYYQQRRMLAEHAADQSFQLIETTEETNMSNKVIFKTVTFINNADVTGLSEEQLIDAIKTIEREIADLKGVTTKSKKIEAKIADAEATLAKVVEVLDGR